MSRNYARNNVRQYRRKNRNGHSRFLSERYYWDGIDQGCWYLCQLPVFDLHYRNMCYNCNLSIKKFYSANIFLVFQYPLAEEGVFKFVASGLDNIPLFQQAFDRTE